jgi:hypothetical protein
VVAWTYVRSSALMVAVLGCAGCGRGFFNPDPQFQDGAVAGGSDTMPQRPAISYVQATFDSSSTNALNTPLPLSQHAGDALVVSVSWYTTGIASVFDDVGDTYFTAVGPLVGANDLHHEVFYASNVGAAEPGGNRLHIMFSLPTASAVAIAEYANVDPVNLLDGAVGTSGPASQIPSSGEVTVQHDGDLLVGSITVDNVLTSTLTGYSVRAQDSALVLEDVQAASAGAYTATAGAVAGTTWTCSLVGLRRK